MTTVSLIVFWVSVGLVFHSYVLFPVLLKVFAAGKRENENVYALTDPKLPELIIFFSAYNEQRVIREKLGTVFNTTYPAGKFKVYIGSDNSTDDTNRIVEEFRNKYPQLIFFPYTDRNGKSKVLNRLVEEIQRSESAWANRVFVFTDANVMFTPQTFYELAKHFGEPNVGIVGANILNRGMMKEGISQQENAYIQRENQIKYLEGLNWGAVMGAFGACYAMRAECWTPIPDNYLMEDFYLTMNTLKQGRKVMMELKALCYEDLPNEAQEEYRRKIRIQAGNFQNLAVYWPMLFRFNAVAFCFFSHKFLRWMGPLFIVASYAANLFLLTAGRFYVFTFVLQNLLLLSPVIDAFFKKAGLHIRLLRFASYFYLMNLALVSGFMMYAKGVRTNAWNPTKRNVS